VAEHPQRERHRGAERDLLSDQQSKILDCEPIQRLAPELVYALHQPRRVQGRAGPCRPVDVVERR
jgi:hypothetical protein